MLKEKTKIIKQAISKIKDLKISKSKTYPFQKISKIKDPVKLLLEEWITFVQNKQFKWKK